jgi:hypothetical protein
MTKPKMTYRQANKKLQTASEFVVGDPTSYFAGYIAALNVNGMVSRPTAKRLWKDLVLIPPDFHSTLTVQDINVDGEGQGFVLKLVKRQTKTNSYYENRETNQTEAPSIFVSSASTKEWKPPMTPRIIDFTSTINQ